MKAKDELTKMAERAGAAEVRENNALARIEHLEKEVLPAILEDLRDQNYDGIAAIVKTALNAKLAN